MTMQVLSIKSGGYTAKFTGDNAHRDALKATRQYLNRTQWNTLVDQIKAGGDLRRIRFLACIAGVQGYPISAMIREFHPRYAAMFGASK
jgi:hypothetical protein